MTVKSNIQYPEGRISSEEPQRRKRKLAKDVELHIENQSLQEGEAEAVKERHQNYCKSKLHDVI